MGARAAGLASPAAGEPKKKLLVGAGELPSSRRAPDGKQGAPVTGVLRRSFGILSQDMRRFIHQVLARVAGSPSRILSISGCPLSFSKILSGGGSQSVLLDG